MNTTLKKPKRLTNKNSFLLLFPPPRMLRRASFLLLLFLLSSSFSCKEDPPIIPPPPQAKLTLTLEDVSCTEAWLNLKLENITLPVDLELKEDSTVIKTFLVISSTDTTLHVDSLLPKQTYNLQFTSIQNPVSSNQLSITTLDTTSHNFTWQSWEFGEHSHSILTDVAVIDENNIWAVGEIYMNDSLGNPDNNAYNAMHWDGNEWSLKRIYTYSSCNAVNFAPLRAICAFSDTNLIVTSGGSIGWYNGITNRPDCSIRPLLTGSINRIWGTSSSDLYVVGNAGNIAHYNGSQWTKIESGTDIDLLDIYGTTDGEVIWIVGTKVDRVVFIKIENDELKKIYEGSAYDLINGKYVGDINSVWAKNRFMTYYLNPGWGEINIQETFKDSLNPKTLVNLNEFMYKMRGLDHNEIYLAGQSGTIGLFNGISYRELYSQNNINSDFYSLGVNNSNIVAVGTNNQSVIKSTAIITMGKKK